MKYHKLIENAAKPEGFWGKLMLRSMNKGHHALTDWALAYVDPKNGCRALDIGCGGGRTVRKLCDLVGSGKVTGVDYSALCVKKSEKLNSKNVLCGRAEFRQASVSELPFAEDSFDLVTGIETYYFWPDKLNDLKEVRRVMRRNGTLLLVFEMMKDDSDPDKWKAVEKRLGVSAVGRSEIAEMLLRAGFQNIRTHVKSDNGWLCATAEKE